MDGARPLCASATATGAVVAPPPSTTTTTPTTTTSPIATTTTAPTTTESRSARSDGVRCHSADRNECHRQAAAKRQSASPDLKSATTTTSRSDERQSKHCSEQAEPKQTDKENRNIADEQRQTEPSSEQRCFECKLSLTKSSHLINVDGRAHKWHPECFRCKVCQHQMDRELSCHIYKDQLLCRNDYKRLKRDHSSAKCARCQWPISALDWVRRANNFVYHLACFSCDMCSRQLNTGEQFAIETAAGSVRLLCRLHFAIDPTLSDSTQALSGAYFRKGSPTNEEQVCHRPSASDQAQRVKASFNNEDLNQESADRTESSSTSTSNTVVEHSTTATLNEQYLQLLGSSNATAQQQNRHYSPVIEQVQETTARKGSSSPTSSLQQQHNKHHTHPHGHRHARCNMSNQHTINNEQQFESDAALNAVSLYERRNLGRPVPLMLPGLVSARTHSLGHVDMNQATQMGHDIPIEPNGASLANIDTTGCGSIAGDHCGERAATINLAPHSSSANGDSINNIASSNCSSISNGSNTSNSGNQLTLSNGSKSKRVRTTFTEDQLAILQTHFQIDSNPDGQDLERIATITGLSKRVTQVWFQNSRARQKKYMTKRKPASLVTSGMALSATTQSASSSLLPVSSSGETHANDDQSRSLVAMSAIVCGGDTEDGVNN